MINAEARFNNSLRPRKPEGSLGRTAQDVHLDSHTAPELCRGLGASVYNYKPRHRPRAPLSLGAKEDGACGTETAHLSSLSGPKGFGASFTHRPLCVPQPPPLCRPQALAHNHSPSSGELQRCADRSVRRL